MKNSIDYGKSIAAIVAGYFVMSGIGSVSYFIIRKLLQGSLPPEVPTPTRTYFVVALLVNFGTAFIGGYVAAAISGAARLAHSLILAGILLAVGCLVVYFSTQTDFPRWYTLLATTLVPTFVVVGGWMRSRRP